MDFSAVDAHFSLDRSPPFHVPAQELLQSVVSGLPAWAPRPCTACCYSREACVLVVHAFWYCFCGLRQPGSEAEQQALLRMMAQQMARLTLRLCCDGDAFFAAYPPVLAQAVLAALRGRGLLTPTAGIHAHANTGGSTNRPPLAAPDIFRHLVALLGCALPAKLLSRHLELVRRAGPEGEDGGGRPAAEAAPGIAGGARMPPPLSSYVAPLQSGGQSGGRSSPQRGGGSGGGGDGYGDGAPPPRPTLKELKVQLGIGTPPPRSRPSRLLVDLRRTSPLLQPLHSSPGSRSGGLLLAPERGGYPGAHASSASPSPLAASPLPRTHAASGWLPGAASRGAVAVSPPAGASPASLARPSSLSSLRGSSSLGSLAEERSAIEARRERVRRPHYGMSMATHVKHSVPDERCTLGGTESYKGKHDRGAVSRAAALRRQFQAAKAEAAADDRKARARVAEEVRELDAQQAEILSRSPPLLSEHTSQLAHRLLNPPKYYEK